jgi:prophage antirepressor-like protein
MEAKSATPGGIQEKWFLTEDGLYEVCMQSHKPIELLLLSLKVDMY